MIKKALIKGFAIVPVLAAGAIIVGYGWSGSGDPKAEIHRNTKALGAVEKVHAKIEVDGDAWVMGGYRNSAGETCASQSIPEEGTSFLCLDRARMFADGREIVAFPGGRQKSSKQAKLQWDNLWVYGFATERVNTLELVSMDCSTRALQLDNDRAFMHVVSRSEIVRGIIPLRLVARDAAGSVIYKRDVDIGLPNNAKKAGQEEPQPGKSCA